jgi:hypothetical protein
MTYTDTEERRLLTLDDAPKQCPAWCDPSAHDADFMRDLNDELSGAFDEMKVPGDPHPTFEDQMFAFQQHHRSIAHRRLHRIVQEEGARTLNAGGADRTLRGGGVAYTVEFDQRSRELPLVKLLLTSRGGQGAIGFTSGEVRMFAASTAGRRPARRRGDARLIVACGVTVPPPRCSGRGQRRV